MMQILSMTLDNSPNQKKIYLNILHNTVMYHFCRMEALWGQMLQNPGHHGKPKQLNI